MQEKKMRVLFLPRWYPHRQDAMPGLFIQRQAESLTDVCDVAVVYIHAEQDCPNKLEVEFSEENQVRVLRVYYQAPSGKFPGFSKLAGFYRFYRVQMKALKSICEFQPDLVHAHVLTRMGFIALRYSKKQNIPFVISEHWSRYFPENRKFNGFFKKAITRRIVRKAAAMLVVSNKLKQAMLDYGLKNEHYRIIPNIVDPQLFDLRPERQNPEKKTLIHVSCFEDRSKNISGFLRAIKKISSERQDFQCLMVGDGPDLEEMKDYAGSLEIKDTFVIFTGLKTGIELVEIINQADFLVLSSHYETFGTVVVESLSCGTPVLATPVGIVPEVIHAGNGMIIPNSGDEDLKIFISRMLDLCRNYDRRKIRADISEKYTAERVGKEISEIYRQILQK